MKFIFFIILLFYFSGCSFNSNSDFWNETNKSNSQNNKNENNEKVDINKSFKKLKDEVIKYGKNKNFPNINN